MVCKDVATKPVLQDVAGGKLTRTTCNIHPSDFCNNWWNVKGVLELPQQTSRVDCFGRYCEFSI